MPDKTFTNGAGVKVKPSEIPESEWPRNWEKCTVAAGCFWGVEHIFREYYGQRGILEAAVGYTGGTVKADSSKPTYHAVCGGRTGHAEALRVIFDNERINYRELIEFFYKTHDPTTPNKQGADGGSQYRSAIFYHGDRQKAIAHAVTDAITEETRSGKNWMDEARSHGWWKKSSISTEIAEAGPWFEGEKYHQRYLDINPGGYQCSTHFLREFENPLSATKAGQKE